MKKQEISKPLQLFLEKIKKFIMLFIFCTYIIKNIYTMCIYFFKLYLYNFDILRRYT